MKIASSATIRNLEERAHKALKNGEPSLMTKASTLCARFIYEFKQKHPALRDLEIITLAGRGNNGGDGILASSILRREYNEKVTVYSLQTPAEMTDEIRRHFFSLPSDLSVKFIKSPSDFPDLKKPCLIVDALLGIGFKGSLRSPVRELIKSVNSSNNPVISIDIPSGIETDTGRGEDGISADMTISIGAQKKGLFINDGRNRSGIVKFADIGFELDLIPANECIFEVIDENILSEIYRRPDGELYKNRNGKVLIIGGSKLYPGAAILSIAGADATGCGLLSAALKSLPYSAIPPNVIVRDFSDSRTSCFNANDCKALTELGAGQDCIVFGMGVTANEETAAVLEQLLKLQKNMILDADALNCIALFPEIWQKAYSAGIIVTPHPGEATKLAQAFDIKEFGTVPRDEQAKILAQKMQCTVILKGEKSFAASADGKIYVNPSGNYGLAKGGSGDILSGICGSLLARTDNTLLAACGGMYLHGTAADFAVRSRRAFRISELPEAIKNYLDAHTIF